jgi:hypothetical protein
MWCVGGLSMGRWQELNDALSVVSAGLAGCSELLLPIQPCLRGLTSVDVHCLLANDVSLYSRASNMGVESVCSHYTAGLSTALQRTVEVVGGLVRNVLVRVVDLVPRAVAMEDIGTLQVGGCCCCGVASRCAACAHCDCRLL